MQNALSQNQELREMQDHVHRVVNSLELCWHCERICECERWSVQAAAVWLCSECLSETLQGLAQPPEVSASIRAALPKLLSDLNGSERLSVEVEREPGVWTRACPRCGAVLEKKRLGDSWSCARCGWQ